MNADGSLTCSEGMQDDGSGGCEPLGGAKKAELVSDIENGFYEELNLSGDFAGVYKMTQGLGMNHHLSIIIYESSLTNHFRIL